MANQDVNPYAAYSRNSQLRDRTSAVREHPAAQSRNAPGDLRPEDVANPYGEPPASVDLRTPYYTTEPSGASREFGEETDPPVLAPVGPGRSARIIPHETSGVPPTLDYTSQLEDWKPVVRQWVDRCEGLFENACWFMAQAQVESGP